jgi:hypothetical protein
LKKYYIIGFILLIAFLLFVAAASAGPDSEVVMGTIGFFGIVALLPLFLYVIIAETRHIEEDIEGDVFDQKEQEVPMIVPKALEQKHIETYGTGTPTLQEKTKHDSARRIDHDFIEGIREKHKDKPKGVEKEPEPKTELLDIPEKVDKVPLQEVERGEQPEEGSGSALIDIPDPVEEKSEPEEKIDEQLVSGLRADKNKIKDEEVKESEKGEEPKDPSKEKKQDVSNKKEKEDEPEKDGD